MYSDGSGGEYCTFKKEKDGLIEVGDKTHLKVFGMSSYEAMEKFGGLDKEYRAAEGKSELVPYKGKAEDVIKEILGGLRSTCTYIGAKSLKDIPKCANFIRIR